MWEGGVWIEEIYIKRKKFAEGKYFISPKSTEIETNKRNFNHEEHSNPMAKIEKKSHWFVGGKSSLLWVKFIAKRIRNNGIQKTVKDE